MEISSHNQESRASIYSDIHSLNHIREVGQSDSRAAIKSAAKEFEAFFMNMMLKSMREASAVIGDDSMLSSPQEKMFVGMLDEQMSVELSQKGNLGIADLMVRDILGEQSVPHQQGSFQPIIKNIKTNKDGKYYNDVTPHQAPQLLDSVKSKLVQNSEHILDQVAKMPVQALSDIAEPIKKSLFDNAKSFVETLAPFANKIAAKLGIDPRVLLAQSALETGWGQHVMHDGNNQPSNNLFGIKTSAQWEGKSVQIDTLEVENNEFVKKKDEFRMYSSFEQSFSDYIELVKENPRYEKALEVVHDAKAYLQHLQKAGYATDPNYANKILKIFNTSIIQNASVNLN